MGPLKIYSLLFSFLSGTLPGDLGGINSWKNNFLFALLSPSYKASLKRALCQPNAPLNDHKIMPSFFPNYFLTKH